MLTPKQLQEIVETMQPLLDDLNTWITKDIIKRVVARMSRGEDWLFGATDISQAEVFRDLGGHFDEMQRQIMSFTRIAEEEIRRIFQYTGLTAYDADAEMYRQAGLEVPTLRQSPRILQILDDTYQRTKGEVRNFTRTTANASQRKLIQVLDLAHIKVMSGATSYAVAVRDAVNELANYQAYVLYPTGHTDTLEVAVLRAVRTGTAQASGNMSMGTMEQYGWEIVLTSAHLGARYGDGGENPGNHFWWQGRFFSRTGKDPCFPDFVTSTGYGSGEGLCGWNCRHSFGPGDGVHNPWRQYDAQENKEAYDLSQRQRKKERDIRSQAKKVAAFKAAVEAVQSDDVRNAMKEALREEQAKLTGLRKDYGDFCDESDLKRQAFRLEVAKAQQQEAERTFYSGSSTSPENLTESAKGGTIDIEVDEMTPCLRKNSTGELVDTTVRSISPTKATCKGWEFDWTKPERDGYQVFALRVKGERTIQGMIAMKDDPGNYAMKIDIVESAPQNNPHNPLNTSGTKEYNGVGGHLFAEACRQSFEKGYGGFVHFVAKTNLIPHYAKTLGAVLINPRERVMAIDGPAALALVQRYYGGGK